MIKRALIVVDLQNEYLADGNLSLVGIDTAVSNAARIISDTRAKGKLIIHVRHESPQSGAKAFVPGTNGVKIVSAVAPIAGEPVVVKNFPNSFRETTLKQLLDEHHVKDITVVGAMSHMCVEATARAAADFGYPVTVVHDACATRDLEFGGMIVPAAQVHAASMAALGFGYASLVSTDTYLSSNAS